MSNDAIVLLREDHKEVRRLFRAYRESAGDDAAREGTVERIVEALTVHTYLEDELVYPKVREQLPALAGEMRRAEQEHHVADLLCEELSRMSSGDEEYDAKVLVLIDAVERHIEEEEGSWFPQVRAALGRKELQELGERMLGVRETAPRKPERAGVLHRVADALEG
ncbi:hypothetical protein CFP65_7056 [Kitasatospora sp. MMS16-BH015]|uniref:hemerythrin domain-containing protein n=1 Tax=Kitasatospora sp. MMS16-BH015 TaxID=2018025 RepID=UPI000CA230D5|nr:hemerythrin domain-containing protein [Kitasatospora sp. MMS16-BH015]AUG81661.1 hypothetical protein CFP65_7056 [Kitasatospora sp. MMS16-BH015]